VQLHTILITGGAGYVGTELTKSLLLKGHSVQVVDTFWFGDNLKEHPNLIKIKTDIREFDLPGNLKKPDTIIHLASIANDPSADLSPELSWEIGCLGTLKVINWAISNNIENFLLASSGSVYGVSDEPKVTEEIPLLPISIYNKVKMIKERIVLSYSDKMRVVILRPATVAGVSDRQRLDLAVNALTFAALDKGEITVFGGDQIRPHVHMKDLISAYEFFIDNNYDGIYNVGFENTSIKDLGQQLSKITGAPVKVMQSNDPRSYRLNSDKLLGLGFTPKYKVVDAIADVMSAYQSGKLMDNPIHYNVNWLKNFEN
jgi:nucleoside-diphosphate-sugar epimerase